MSDTKQANMQNKLKNPLPKPRFIRTESYYDQRKEFKPPQNMYKILKDKRNGYDNNADYLDRNNGIDYGNSYDYRGKARVVDDYGYTKKPQFDKLYQPTNQYSQQANYDDFYIPNMNVKKQYTKKKNKKLYRYIDGLVDSPIVYSKNHKSRRRNKTDGQIMLRSKSNQRYSLKPETRDSIVLVDSTSTEDEDESILFVDNEKIYRRKNFKPVTLSIKQKDKPKQRIIRTSSDKNYKVRNISRTELGERYSPRRERYRRDYLSGLMNDSNLTEEVIRNYCCL